MGKNKIILLIILISFYACENRITDASIVPPADVTEMMGIWDFNTNISFRDSLRDYTCNITNAKIYVGNLLNSD